MIENLFGSKTRYKLLQLFLSNPNRSFYVREITRKINEQINSVRRELSNLLSIGILVSDSSNNRLYYEVNQQFDKYKDLVNLFKGNNSNSSAEVSVNKNLQNSIKTSQTSTLNSDRDSDKLIELGNVSLVILSGIFTRDRKAPADLLVVGNVTPHSLRAYIDQLEQSIEGELSYLLLDEADFNYRRQIKDKFVSLMLESKLVVKIDKYGIID